MKKKDECETALRKLCYDWANECGIKIPPDNDPGFSNFTEWLHKKGYGSYLNFRSVAGPMYDAEMWFDQVMKVTWKR